MQRVIRWSGIQNEPRTPKREAFFERSGSSKSTRSVVLPGFESPLEHHNSTLILIESGYCYFYQRPQYFWAFQRFKADLGSSRERPFLRLWIFQPTPAKLGFVELFLGSLILWGVR